MWLLHREENFFGNFNYWTIVVSFLTLTSHHQTGERERERENFSSDHSLLTVSGAEGHVSTSNVELRLSKVSGGAIHPFVHMHMQNAVATWLRPSVCIGEKEGLSH